MEGGNPYVGVNYIADNENMAVPPSFWLQRLFDYDDKLVVFPSRKIPYAYVLARRRHLTAGLTDSALEAHLTNPDTIACMHYGLVPVSIIYRTGTNWDIDNIIRSLMARDIWRHGGAEKYADKMDEADASIARNKQHALRDDMWARSGDAWQSYLARTGQRVGYAPPAMSAAVPSVSSSTRRSGIVTTDI